MDGPTISGKVYYGHAKAAKYLGYPFAQYRPSSASNPIAPGNMIATLNASFTNHGPANFNFNSPSTYKDPLNNILIDDRLIQAFDYLVSATQGTYFVSNLTPSMPTLGVLCNRILTVSTEGTSGAPLGASGYGGTTQANEVPFMIGWPASVLIDRLVREQPLPGDSGFATYRILMPYWVGALIRGGCIITDDLGRRYNVITAELQVYGWRLSATQAVA